MTGASQTRNRISMMNPGSLQVWPLTEQRPFDKDLYDQKYRPATTPVA